MFCYTKYHTSFPLKMATSDPGQANEEFTTFKDYLLPSLLRNDKPQRHKK